MSHVSLSFLLDSILLDPAAQEDGFSDLTDKELAAELSAYREHILDQLRELKAEVLADGNRLGAFFGTSLCAEPKIRQLMRAGLYFDQLVIDDPLFPHGREPTSGSDAFARLAGYQAQALDRKAVAAGARLIATLQPLVSGGLLKLVPASIQHEPPHEVGISYSPTLFSERVPAPLLQWFHERAEVLPMRRRDSGGWEVRQGDELEPCRGILVRLRGFGGAMTFHLTGIKKHEPLAGRENLLRITQWIPDEPPDPEMFRNWIAQSVNQFSGDVYSRVAADLRDAADFGTLMFTDSQLVSQLLEVQVTEQGGIREDLANLAMRFELPFLDDLSVDDLMTIRQLEGEAFESYRLELQRQLRGLRATESEEELVRSLEGIQHEIADVQVRHVQKEARRLNRDLFREAVVGAASLATMVPSHGISLVTLLVAGDKLWRHTLDYQEVRREPAYFVWRLLQRAQR